MSISLPAILIALSCLSLLGFGFSGLLVSNAHTRTVRRSQRMLDVAVPYRRKNMEEIHAFRPAAAEQKSILELCASVFAIDAKNLDQYPVRWWIALGVAFVAARIAAGLLTNVLGPLGLVSMPVIWVAICRMFFNWASGRRRTTLIKQFPDTLAMIVRSVRVGIPVLGAIATIAREAPVPTSLEFAKLANELAVGVPLDAAVTKLGTRNDLAEYRFFALAMCLQAQTGGGLSDTLENLADLISKRLALRERGYALASEARTSSLILGALPIVMGGGLWLLNPGYMSVLFKTSMGHAILGGAALSLTLGALTMRTIIKKSLA